MMHLYIFQVNQEVAKQAVPLSHHHYGLQNGSDPFALIRSSDGEHIQ